jgi:hypothetical protein
VTKEARLLIFRIRIRAIATTYMREEFLGKNILDIERAVAAR